MMKNKWLTIGFIVLLSVLLSSWLPTQEKVSSVILPTIYTLSGIMFSIGMGVICTFNPSSVKNPKYFQIIKNNIRKVRNAFLLYFSLATISFLCGQLLTRYSFSIYEITTAFDVPLFALICSLVSIPYFILNFITIQKLIFDISERIMTEKQS